MGERVLAARQASGFGRWQAARRLRVPRWELAGWERGKWDIPLDVRHAMAVLYNTAPQYLVPPRPTAVVQDGVNAVVRIGGATIPLEHVDDQSLRRFLAAVREERAAAPNAPMRIRESDAVLLADLLGGTADAISAGLCRLLGLSPADADEYRDWLFGGTAVAAAFAMRLDRLSS